MVSLQFIRRLLHHAVILLHSFAIFAAIPKTLNPSKHLSSHPKDFSYLYVLRPRGFSRRDLFFIQSSTWVTTTFMDCEMQENIFLGHEDERSAYSSW